MQYLPLLFLTIITMVFSLSFLFLSPSQTDVQAQMKLTVALQVGHWQRHQLPEELKKLRMNTGAVWKNYSEEQINMAIAQKTKELLEKKGFDVYLIPATVPPEYKADAFISIHADQNDNLQRRGYKASAATQDESGKAQDLLKAIEKEYARATNLPYDNDITPGMRYYYAFSHWRFQHSIAATTPAIILETGFLTNELDRAVLVNNPEKAAKGIANGIETFFQKR